MENYGYHGGNVLEGKKWTACGDSFTHGDFSGLPEEEWYIPEGRYQGKLRVYPYIIGNRNNMDVVNMGVNGATIAMCRTRPAGEMFTNGFYQDIPADSDYITFCYGINDWHQNVPLGLPEDTDVWTYYGAWNTVLEDTIGRHPYAHIGIIITNGTTAEYTHATREVARRWGIPYLDMQADDRVPMMHRVYERPGICAAAMELRNRNFTVSDKNRHPSPEAHEYESTFIENFLRSL